MNNTSPFSFLESIATRFQPPAWVVDEGQQRLVLFLNHVLLQEKQAQDRLLRQKGRVVHLKWGLFAIDLIVTPAGLADRAPAFSKPDLVLSVAAESPLAVVQAALAGKAPPIKIEGDVQLAAEIGWLAENLRWDAEEDLSRLIGDAPAHALADVGRRLASGLKQFLAKGPFSPSAPSASTVPTPTPERERSAASTVPGSPPSAPGTVRDAVKDGYSEFSQPLQAGSPPQGDKETDDVKSVVAPTTPKAAA
ncbi:MAG: hypothetical protein ABIR56_10490 [Polaromonas sp.]